MAYISWSLPQTIYIWQKNQISVPRKKRHWQKIIDELEQKPLSKKQQKKRVVERQQAQCTVQQPKQGFKSRGNGYQLWIRKDADNCKAQCQGTNAWNLRRTYAILVCAWKEILNPYWKQSRHFAKAFFTFENLHGPLWRIIETQRRTRVSSVYTRPTWSAPICTTWRTIKFSKTV